MEHDEPPVDPSERNPRATALVLLSVIAFWLLVGIAAWLV